MSVWYLTYKFRIDDDIITVSSPVELGNDPDKNDNRLTICEYVQRPV